MSDTSVSLNLQTAELFNACRSLFEDSVPHDETLSYGFIVGISHMERLKTAMRELRRAMIYQRVKVEKATFDRVLNFAARTKSLDSLESVLFNMAHWGDAEYCRLFIGPRDEDYMDFCLYAKDERPILNGGIKYWKDNKVWQAHT